MEHFTPKKRFGQHFLTSQGALTSMVSEANLNKGDTVVEIGPGKGVLTEHLVKTGATVITFEKDRDLIPILREKFSKEIEQGRVRILEGDIRDIVIEEQVHGPYSVVANIPYYITGTLLRSLLTSKKPPKQMILLVQKEVAERMVDQTHSSLLSLSVCIYGTPKFIKKVKRGSFTPPPKVDSAIVSIQDISKDNLVRNKIDETLFFSVLKAGFSSKRKLVRNNIEKNFPKNNMEEIFSVCNIPLNSRAENLRLSDWICITQKLQ